MEITKIDFNIDKINKIYHISDVHIRTLKRHTEYREVFNRLFDYINSTAKENDIAMVTGDIVHSKLDMSPELIDMLVEFFEGFTIPTVVILGNHDMNLNNLYRKDAISPILKVIKNPNIIFIKENGLFELGGIVFNHMAVDVTPDKYIRANQFDAPYKIALHHGAVHSAKTDIGYEISNEHVTTELFAGHDITLLGDIHKPAQFLNEEKTIAYPGSLIQQSHGEVLTHGILVWDTNNNSAEFVEIENDYGYVTIEVQGTTITNSLPKIPKKPRVRIKFADTSAADMKKLLSNIRKRYDIQDISIQRTSNSIETDSTSSFSVGNVRDVEYQNTLLTDFIQLNQPQVTTEELDAIRHINRTINSKLPAVETVRHITWQPISFEFSNMFSYGEDNAIAFDDMQGIFGLFAANTSGKSSLLDAITYTIFDKCSKTSKAHEVLNNKKSTFTGKFTFSISDTIYTIIRTGIKQKNGHVKVNVEFYTESENLNGEERSETNKNIRRYLGTYDDFILTAFSLQADNNNFIEKSQRERKDLLSQFLDITVFEQLYQLASDEIKETAGKLKQYKNTDFDIIITNADTDIRNNQSEIIDLEQQEHDLQETRNEAQSEILTLIESKLPTSYNGADITELQKAETLLEEKIEKLQTSIDQLETKSLEVKTKFETAKTQADKINLTDIQSKLDLLTEYETEEKSLLTEISNTESIIDGKNEKIKHLESHEYDPECEYCTSNVFVQSAIEAKDSIETDIQILDVLHGNLVLIENNIEQLKPVKTQYKNALDLIDTASNLKNQSEKIALQLQVLENDLQTKESELELNVSNQDLFKQNEVAIKTNSELDKQISNQKLLVSDCDKKIKKITIDVKGKHGIIEVAKTKKENAIEQLDQYKKLETEYKGFEYYLKAIKRDGIPYELVSKAIPKIESEINNVLNQVVDFSMTMQTDGKNINGYIVYDEDNYWPLELTSGMERFISSLAIRIALINVSTLPRPNFIAIDEGWGSLDAEHISAVTNLFDYFRNKFEFCVIISHVDTMRDMVDSLIEVNKIDNFSHISKT